METFSDKELINELKKRLTGVSKSDEEIRILQKKLKEVNLKLSDSEQMKSHFISNISNEILNPFTSILGLSKSILEVEKENWKKVVSMVALIHSEAFNLDFQLKNIIAAAKTEAGEISPEISKVDIKGLLLDIMDSFKYEAHKKHLTIKLSCNIDESNGTFTLKQIRKKSG